MIKKLAPDGAWDLPVGRNNGWLLPCGLMNIESIVNCDQVVQGVRCVCMIARDNYEEKICLAC